MRGTEEQIRTLSLLAINPRSVGVLPRFKALNPQGRSELLRLADAHHVTMRALSELYLQAMSNQEFEVSGWAQNEITAEEEKINAALDRLAEICDVLEREGIPVTVIKSLDHWPDLGRDLDLFTTAGFKEVRPVLVDRLNAKFEARSAGDCFASKWSFTVPGCRKIFEAHCGRLGQMGEHTALAKRFTLRRVPIRLRGYQFHVPAAEEQLIAATLQRMYRHLFFRLCDVVNTATLLRRTGLSWSVLRSVAIKAGIWRGVASFLKIVADYVGHYRGRPLELPDEVVGSAECGADCLFVRGSYLRVPLMHCGIRLFVDEFTATIASGKVSSAMRLGILPVLASVAGVKYKLTGNTQGVW